MRVIDADPLKIDIVEEGQRSRRYKLGEIWEFNRDEIYKVIDEQPTIEPESHWIPCSERLPKEEDYRECMECLDGAVWYYTNRNTMGLGYYYDSTKQWSTIYDMKPDGKVIAWMPLPEPYKENET